MKKILTLSLLLLATLSFSFAQSSRVQDLDHFAFDELLDGSDEETRLLVGDTPIIIDFSASWCGPCKQFAPIYDETSLKFDGKVDFYKVDIDECPELKEFFEISVVPTIVFIPVYGEPRIFEGAPSEAEELIGAINEFLL